MRSIPIFLVIAPRQAYRAYALLGLMWFAILVQASHALVTSNDASRLNPTGVREVIQVISEQQAREALAFAAAHHFEGIDCWKKA